VRDLSETINTVKDALSRAIEVLRESTVEEASEGARRELLTRLQSAQNSLVRNERKIWLRTKAGKEMLAEFEAASAKLKLAVESGSGFDEVEDALAGVEAQAKRIEEETRRRSMVVT
jgi:hypothetical protein